MTNETTETRLRCPDCGRGPTVVVHPDQSVNCHCLRCKTTPYCGAGYTRTEAVADWNGQVNAAAQEVA